MLSRLENGVLGNALGLEALDAALTRSTDALLRRKNKRRLIIDLDSTEDPVHGKQECAAQLTFRPNLRYHALDEKIWLREEDRLGDFTRAKRALKPRGAAIVMDVA